MTKHKPYWIWAAPLSFLCMVLDQLSKAVVMGNDVFNARACLAPAREACGRIELSNVFDLSMVWNYGMSFGMLQSDGLGRWLLLLVSTGIAIGFGAWLMKAERRITALALALVIGGAVGNMIDRARFGAVVDFMDFSGPWLGIQMPAQSGPLAWIDQALFVPDGVLGLGFPYVFNVADVAISVGAVLLFADQVLAGRRTSV